MASTSKMAKTVVGVVIAATIGAVLLGAVFPVGINFMVSDDSTTLTQDNGTSYTVDEFETNVTDVTSSGATIEMTHDGSTVTNTVSTGSSTDYSLPGGTVNVTVDSTDTSTTPDQATVTYTYDTTFGWPDAVALIFNSLVYFLILLPLAALAAIVVDMFDIM